MMAMGYPQLKACFFEYNVLQHYAFDPRKNLKFNDYQGEIHSDADINSTQYINLKTFGIGRNKVLKTEDIHPPKTGISVHFSGSLV